MLLWHSEKLKAEYQSRLYHRDKLYEVLDRFIELDGRLSAGEHAEEKPENWSAISENIHDIFLEYTQKADEDLVKVRGEMKRRGLPCE